MGCWCLCLRVVSPLIHLVGSRGHYQTTKQLKQVCACFFVCPSTKSWEPIYWFDVWKKDLLCLACQSVLCKSVCTLGGLNKATFCSVQSLSLKVYIHLLVSGDGLTGSWHYFLLKYTWLRSHSWPLVLWSVNCACLWGRVCQMYCQHCLLECN